MDFFFEKHTRNIRKRRIGKIMTKRALKTVDKDLDIPSLLGLFEKYKVNDFPVLENDMIIGDVSVTDILPFAINPEDISEHEVIGVLGTELHDIFGRRVEDIMKFHEEIVSPDALVADVALLMWRDELRCLAVVEDDKLVGVVSQTDIVDMLFRELKKVKK